MFVFVVVVVFYCLHVSVHVLKLHVHVGFLVNRALNYIFNDWCLHVNAKYIVGVAWCAQLCSSTLIVRDCTIVSYETCLFYLQPVISLSHRATLSPLFSECLTNQYCHDGGI